MRKGIETIVVEFVNNEHYKTMTRKEIGRMFCENTNDRKIFNELLNRLDREGKILISNNKIKSINNLEGMFVGTISIKKKGFGFITDENTGEEFFVGKSDRNGAFNGDKVLVRINSDVIPLWDRDDDFDVFHKEASVVKIIERSSETFVGTLDYRNNKFGFVVVDDTKFDSDIFVPKKFLSGAKNGDKVVVKVNNWDGNNPEGVITEVLGKSGSNEVEILSIIKSHGLDVEFSKATLKETDQILDYVTEKDLVGREDFRDRLIYTIDGDDSKDFDDAISVDKLDNGNYELGVYIADVTHYVKENQPLDIEAKNRATSVYLVDKVIPMLPKKLSNGICSLNPDVDRLTLSCIMEVDYKTGKVVDYRFSKSVIRSKARMTYTEISDLLENGDDKMLDKYKDFEDSLRNASDLANILFQRRLDRGAIEFDFIEPKIILDENGMPIEIKAYERRTSNKMIEEFMLLANETVAEHFYKLEIPFVYRVHEVPEDEKVESLKDFANSYNLSLNLRGKKVQPKNIQQMLESIDDEVVKKAVSMVVLRTLRQARYSTNNLEHFGLAAPYYTHFTSPIRRYPDLQIHRIIKDVLDGEFTEKKRAKYEATLSDVCDNCSTREREAEVCERDVTDFYNSLYIKKYEGEIFKGFVSGVTNFGFFVELDNGVEGLIRLSSLPEYYVSNPKYYTLESTESDDIIKLGQEKIVEVEFVDVNKREIDFKILSRKKQKNYIRKYNKKVTKV